MKSHKSGLSSIWMYVSVFSIEEEKTEALSCISLSLWQKRINHEVKVVFFKRNVAVQFSSVAQSWPTLCDLVDCSTIDLPVHHQLLEFTQTHVYRISDAIQPSHPLSSPSPPTLNLSQHQGLFKWVSSSHQVAKVLGVSASSSSFQWTLRTDFF